MAPAYDVQDRPVQARIRYDGFSGKLVTGGTQSFGRSASDGLLSMGYDTTKRLVMADRHGDIIAGFDPTDGTLSTGLPDTRTYDPFGNSTAATGLKYRVGYQGDWTDPRSGDVNQGARWYDPGTGTFNSRDTMSYAAGAASSLPNLYAYATGNPLTFNDPDGQRAVDPDTGDSLKQDCKWVRKWVGDGYQNVWTCSWTDRDKPPGPDLDDDGPCRKPCTGGPGPGPDDDDGGGGCKKNCNPKPCKSSKCNPKPPPPPKCDAECERAKKAKELRIENERDAKEVAVTPPGNPTCSNGNPSLCPTKPGGPETVVGDYVDTTGGNIDQAKQLQIDAINDLGSVIGGIGTGKFNWLSMSMGGLPQGNSPRDPGGTGGSSATVVGIAVGTSVDLTPVGAFLLGGLLGLGVYLAQDKTGGGSNSGNQASAAGSSSAGAAAGGHEPDDDGSGRKKTKVTSVIGDDTMLSKAARAAGKDGSSQRDFDALTKRFSSGNTNPGKGSKSLEKTDVYYLRGDCGARVFFRNADGGIQIVGKANESNETEVINRLKKLYGR